MTEDTILSVLQEIRDSIIQIKLGLIDFREDLEKGKVFGKRILRKMETL